MNVYLIEWRFNDAGRETYRAEFTAVNPENAKWQFDNPPKVTYSPRHIVRTWELVTS